MLEKRQHTRFHPGSALSASLELDYAEGFGPGVEELRGQVEDVSSRGFKLLLPAEVCHGLKQGQQIRGTLFMASGKRPWSGKISHLSPRLGGICIGIATEVAADYSQSMDQTLAQVMLDPKTGGISLRRDGDSLVLDVIGHLSLPLSRDFLHLVRSDTLTAINLNQCKGMDSAGLGMLCIATDAGVPLIHAHGLIRDLLVVARLPLDGEPLPKQSFRATSNPIRPHAKTTADGRPLVLPSRLKTSAH